MISTIMAAGSFSVILAESFAAVGLSTMIPQMFVGFIRTINKAEAANLAVLDSLGKFFADRMQVKYDTAFLKKLMDDKFLNELDLLIPKDGRIKAEFIYQGTETYTANMGGSVGATLEGMVVGEVSAAYSALYSATTSNKIELEVNFGLVHYKLLEDNVLLKQIDALNKKIEELENP